jgi:tetratricopeptide (TPR) repeat protein
VVAGLVPAFGITHLVVGRFNQHRQDLAFEWTSRGAGDLGRDSNAAVADFETALSYSGDDFSNRSQLATALIAAGRPTEAEAHLRTLWAEEPGNGRINLELARLAAQRGDLGDAVRGYHAAVDGAWEEGAAAARRAARLELVRLLLASNQNVPAQAELIALIGDLPPDTTLITDIGDLLVEAGAANRAIALFERALVLDPANHRAAESAGRVAFRDGNYAQASEYLARAAGTTTLEPPVQQMLDLSRRVVALDPFTARLTARERSRRLQAALAVARARVERCAPSGTADVDSAARIKDLATRENAIEQARKRRRAGVDPEYQDDLSSLVFAIESLPEPLCGPDTLDDRALQLIAGQERTRPQ